MYRALSRHLLKLLQFLSIALVVVAGPAHAQRLETPRQHDRPPGPPLSAEEAVAKMTVPGGFSVEIVAAEPDVVNPVAMCIDEKGRFWVTESFEYPRREPGPGRDRVKVLEDTDGDGRVDKTTVFADGLNIPSGVAVGYGGVWVANSPDILFMQDTDGDLKADKIETVVTGFGRTDTHELPNSLTWGPDGWLYGLNGVFNYSDVKYAESNPNYDPDHPGWEFTCAMFRIHPRTRKFEIFAEGTSNPWGIAINEDGEFFISACVIDHLWHIVETGYYIRQGGPYPPHTWPMGSIVEHKHQKAAYCGITWFDSDAYPEEYRGVLYMGNIHGGCINADIAERHGSTYQASPHPGFPAKPQAWDNDEYGTIRKTGDPDDPKLADFLTANDPWFMPVVQKTGPDGCLYILDWYDRYHCYQDANADPEGIDRGKGRLYRVRYKDTPHTQPFDLTTKTDDVLIELLSHPNVYYRQTAQRLLAERESPSIYQKLLKVVQSDDAPQRDPYRAFFTLGSLSLPPTPEWVEVFKDHDDPTVRAWGLRIMGDYPSRNDKLAQNMLAAYCRHCVEDESPIARLQAVIAASKVVAVEPLGVDVQLAAIQHSDDDSLLSHIVWQNLKPYLLSSPSEFVRMVGRIQFTEGLTGVDAILSRAVEPVIDGCLRDRQEQLLGVFLRTTLGGDVDRSVAQHFIQQINQRIQSGQLSKAQLDTFRNSVGAMINDVASTPDDPVHLAALSLQTHWGDAHAMEEIMRVYHDDGRSTHERIEALQTLIASGKPQDVIDAVRDAIASESAAKDFRVGVIECVSDIQDHSLGAYIANLIVNALNDFDPDVRPKAVEVLTQRPTWSVTLLKAIDTKQIDKDSLNLNQIRRVAAMKDETLQELVAKVFGSVRSESRGDRRRVVFKMRNYLSSTPGDPHKGVEVFKKVCGQCHKMHGEGAEVGPDITRNGRNDWMQLLYNVFDPSQVIGPGYQARVLVTTEGRVLTGLAVEESDQRVVLKIQGGKIESIPRTQIEEYKVSEVSMMPEQLEKQLKPQEIADLFSYLALDKPPSDPTATYLPGAPRHDH